MTTYENNQNYEKVTKWVPKARELKTDIVCKLDSLVYMPAGTIEFRFMPEFLYNADAYKAIAAIQSKIEIRSPEIDKSVSSDFLCSFDCFSIGNSLNSISILVYEKLEEFIVSKAKEKVAEIAAMSCCSVKDESCINSIKGVVVAGEIKFAANKLVDHSPEIVWWPNHKNWTDDNSYILVHDGA